MAQALDLVTCDWCGKEFPPVPDAFCEGGFDMECEGCGAAIDPDDLSTETRERMKAEMGLTDAQFGHLLEHGYIEGVGLTLCLECQDECD